MQDKLLELDIARYPNIKSMPSFQWAFRKCQDCENRFERSLYHILYRFLAKLYHIEISVNTKIGGGLYIGHPYSITINPSSVIGRNCNIHKGVTIGQENRGSRKGTPTVGDNVWIGINSTIVGNITVADDVLIAPNSYVNRDIPAHSVVFGNPCIIKHRDCATQDYI